jgi:hypothetical protein
MLVFKDDSGAVGGVVDDGVAGEVDESGLEFLGFEEHALEVGWGDVHFGAEVEGIALAEVGEAVADHLELAVEAEHEFFERVGTEEE